MKKFYVGNLDNLNNEERRKGCVSYGRIIDNCIPHRVLCNNVADIDHSVWDNIPERFINEEIYQWYICDLDNYTREILTEYGIILSYSNLLDTDILCVEHCGTSWDYVMTDVEWSNNL